MSPYFQVPIVMLFNTKLVMVGADAAYLPITQPAAAVVDEPLELDEPCQIMPVEFVSGTVLENVIVEKVNGSATGNVMSS